MCRPGGGVRRVRSLKAAVETLGAAFLLSAVGLIAWSATQAPDLDQTDVNPKRILTAFQAL
jgi:hypothetical protein